MPDVDRAKIVRFRRQCIESLLAGAESCEASQQSADATNLRVQALCLHFGLIGPTHRDAEAKL